MKSGRPSSRVLFWTIISYALIIIVLIFASPFGLQSHKKQNNTPSPTVIPTSQPDDTPFSTVAPTPQPDNIPPHVTVENNQLSSVDGLISYYPFNGNADDTSGNRNDGTVYGASLVEDRFGNAESAYDFDGVDDRIEISADSSMDFALGDFSVAGWIKTSHVHHDSNGQIIVDKYPQNGKPWTIRVQPDGKIRFLSDNSVYSTAVVNDNMWHHFVALRSDSAIKLFVDGQLQGAASSTTSASNSMLLCIGCIHDHSLRRLFVGTIDDIRIYNRALTEKEIQSLYQESDD